MMTFPLTLDRLRERAATMYAQTPVISRNPAGQRLRHTYAQVSARSQALARRLLADGLQRGERVGTLMWNHHAHLEAYFGVPAAQGVLHTLNHRLGRDDLAYIINHAQDRILLVDDVLYEVYRSIAPALSTVRQVVVFRYGVDPIGGASRAGAAPAAATADAPAGVRVIDYEDWIADAPACALPLLDENAPASLCYTGGSTGRPKGVVYSHRALVLHAWSQAMVDGYGVGRHDCVLGVVPMFHGNGWGLPFSTALTGAKLVLPGPRLDPDSVLGLIQDEGVTFSAGVPTVWLDVARALEATPTRWRLPANVRIVTGGAAPPEHLFTGLARHGITLYQGWGMTETASVITVSRPAPAHTPGAAGTPVSSQGQAMPVAEVRVMAGGVAVPWDGQSVGEIETRGACVTDAYYEDARPERWSEDGWLRTGDMGTLDANGGLRLLERKEDLIKSGGEWIVPQALENALLAYPGIVECAVIAVPHDKWGERPLALLVTSDDTTLDPSSLRGHLSERFARWQLPEGFVQLDALPRTSVGKLARRELRLACQQWPELDQALTGARVLA